MILKKKVAVNRYDEEAALSWYFLQLVYNKVQIVF